MMFFCPTSDIVMLKCPARNESAKLLGHYCEGAYDAALSDPTGRHARAEQAILAGRFDFGWSIDAEPSQSLSMCLSEQPVTCCDYQLAQSAYWIGSTYVDKNSVLTVLLSEES
jgi:hypothetical protein